MTIPKGKKIIQIRVTQAVWYSLRKRALDEETTLQRLLLPGVLALAEPDRVRADETSKAS